MRSPMAKIVAGVILLGFLTGALILLAAWRQTRVSCDVCITFDGRTRCRTALGQTREEAIRTATDNACATLAAGMTDGIRCANTPPTSVVCSDDTP